MKIFENTFINNITEQFADQVEFKRIILQDIPPFVQEKIYGHVKFIDELDQTFLFTNVIGTSSDRILVTKTKEEILAKRNDYNISQIAIISGIVLDRSNESS